MKFPTPCTPSVDKPKKSLIKSGAGISVLTAAGLILYSMVADYSSRAMKVIKSQEDEVVSLGTDLAEGKALINSMEEYTERLLSVLDENNLPLPEMPDYMSKEYQINNGE